MLLEVLRPLSVGAQSTWSRDFPIILEEETYARGVSGQNIKGMQPRLHAFKN